MMRSAAEPWSRWERAARSFSDEVLAAAASATCAASWARVGTVTFWCGRRVEAARLLVVGLVAAVLPLGDLCREWVGRRRVAGGLVGDRDVAGGWTGVAARDVGAAGGDRRPRLGQLRSGRGLTCWGRGRGP